MHYHRIIFLILFSSFVSFSQSTNYSAKGRVFDKDSGKPLSNVNIYLSGTVWGTTSNEKGDYKLRSVIPAEYQLVFSIIGYKTQSKTVIVKKNRITELDIYLIPVSYELEGITVDSEIPEEWYSDLKTFKEYFLGRTKFADECIIKNELYLNFNNSESNVLTAKISRPLEIINYALGYKIKCELMNFRFSRNESRLKYYIMTHFEEMDTSDSELIRKWETNRREAYLGSIEHFLYSLKKNIFLDEGFDVSTSIWPTKSGSDLYRKKIFTADSLLSHQLYSEYSKLKFNKFLQIEYKNSVEKIKPISWLKIMGIDVTLDKYGIPFEIMPFEVHGSWSNSGLSNMLPKYYFVMNDFEVKQ